MGYNKKHKKSVFKLVSVGALKDFPKAMWAQTALQDSISRSTSSGKYIFLSKTDLPENATCRSI